MDFRWHEDYDFMTCVVENVILLFELPVWTGMKGQSGVMILIKMSKMSNVTRRQKDYDFMTCDSGIFLKFELLV